MREPSARTTKVTVPMLVALMTLAAGVCTVTSSIITASVQYQNGYRAGREDFAAASRCETTTSAATTESAPPWVSPSDVASPTTDSVVYLGEQITATDRNLSAI